MLLPEIRRRQYPRSVNLRLKPLRNLGFIPSLDPPKSPPPSSPKGGRGTLIGLLSPPTIMGARGDLVLIVKQHSLTGFDLKLTLLGQYRFSTYGVRSIPNNHPKYP